MLHWKFCWHVGRHSTCILFSIFEFEVSCGRNWWPRFRSQILDEILKFQPIPPYFRLKRPFWSRLFVLQWFWYVPGLRLNGSWLILGVILVSFSSVLVPFCIHFGDLQNWSRTHSTRGAHFGASDSFCNDFDVFQRSVLTALGYISLSGIIELLDIQPVRKHSESTSSRKKYTKL